MENALKQRCAAVPLKMGENNEVQICLIQNLHRNGWIIPGTQSNKPKRTIRVVLGGHLEKDEDKAICAARETEEEAGVKGHIFGDLITEVIDDVKNSSTAVFLLLVNEELEYLTKK